MQEPGIQKIWWRKILDVVLQERVLVAANPQADEAMKLSGLLPGLHPSRLVQLPLCFQFILAIPPSSRMSARAKRTTGIWE